MSRYKIAEVPASEGSYPSPTLNTPAPALPAAETASEGTHPLALSPEEGMFSVSVEAVIAQCQKLLTAKYTAMVMYANYGDRIRSHFRDSIADHFEGHAKEERTAAYRLAMKITALGGEPTPKISKILDVGTLHEMIMAILQYEKTKISLARDLAAMAGDNLALKTYAEMLCEVDQQHADDMRRLYVCEL